MYIKKKQTTECKGSPHFSVGQNKNITFFVVVYQYVLNEPSVLLAVFIRLSLCYSVWALSNDFEINCLACTLIFKKFLFG